MDTSYPSVLIKLLFISTFTVLGEYFSAQRSAIHLILNYQGVLFLLKDFYKL